MTPSGLSSQASVCPGERVLVVDDDAFIRTVLQRVFANAGLGVETFASASELLALADLSLPGVLLLDVRMPDMSGLELQALLSARGVRLPVIFLTGGSDIPIAVEAMRNGAVDFLEKPFNTIDLIRRVGRALEQWRLAAAPAVPSATARDYERRLATLTRREREVHDCMVLGMTSKLIAQELGGSFRTVEIHRARTMSKMAVAHLADLVRLAVDAGIAAHAGTRSGRVAMASRT